MAIHPIHAGTIRAGRVHVGRVHVGRIHVGSTPRLLLAAALAVAIAGCSDRAAMPADAEAPVAPSATDAATAPAGGTTDVLSSSPQASGAPAAEAGVAAAAVGATEGGDGSDILLSPLSATDVETAVLAGELACAFAVGEEGPLLLAKGDVGSADPARGVVKVGDYVEPVGAPGGFDAMLRGARFAGQGKTVTVAVTGAASDGGESPPSQATLTYDRADGAKRTWTGSWTCGP